MFRAGARFVASRFVGSPRGGASGPELIFEDLFNTYADQAAAGAAGYIFASPATFDAANDALLFNGNSNIRVEGAFDPQPNTQYRMTATVDGRSIGSLVFQNDFSTVGSGFSQNGEFVREFFSSASPSNIRFVSAGSFNGEVIRLKIEKL
jgi:hypothetical protein